MKILHAANFAHIRDQAEARVYTTERAISSGFARSDCCVWDFGVKDFIMFYSQNKLLHNRYLRNKKYGKQKMNAKLLETLKRFAPDLLMLGHTHQIPTATLHAVREALPRIRIAQWWVDSLNPERGKDLERIKQTLPCLDAFFCTTAADYAARNIGSAPQDTAKIRFFPNPLHSELHEHRAFERDQYRHDLFFAGSPAPARIPLISLLQDCAVRHDVGIYGLTQETWLTGAAYVDTIGASKTAISYNRFNNIPLYSSDRVIHLLGNGVLTFHPRVPGMEFLLSEEEVVYFDDLDDLRGKLDEYLAQDDKRRATARAGWEKAHRTFNARRISRFLLETALELPYSENYEWLSIPPTR